MRQKKAKRKSEKVNEPLAKNWYNCSAKINLFLDVIGHRNDGFHKIKSVFAEIDLADKISIKLTEKPDIKISCTSKEIPDRDNLVYKVSCYLKDKYNVKQGIEINLKKNIPLAAGLGGGSSDAAQTLLLCNKVWNLNLTAKQLQSIAEKFGSDISFFLQGGLCLVSGRGEKVEPLETNLQVANVLLVKPKFPISSREAYSLVKIQKAQNRKFEKSIKALQTNNLNLLTENIYNALEPEIISRYAEIKQIKNKLKKSGSLGNLMSGSGPTVFAIFDNYDELLKTQRYFNKNKYWSCRTSIKN